MLLSVIIVNYNVKYFLEQCLSSLQKALASMDAEVWIVDNASTDGSVDYLKSKYPTTKFIINTANVGFGRANNQALQQCKGRYILFLNPDTILPEDCLTRCIDFMTTNAGAGALGIRMIDGSGNFLPESKRSFPSPRTSFYKLTGLSKLFPASKIFSRYALGYLNQYQNHEVGVLAGAFLMSRKEILLKLNGFDEAFFMYGEDIDLSYRIQKSGYKNYYFGESTIIHFKGESTKKGSLNYVKMFYQAMSVFVQKHYTGSSGGFFSVSIHSAIWLTAGFSATAKFMQRIAKNFLPAPGTTASKAAKLLIVGSREEYLEVKNLLEHAGRTASIECWVATDPILNNFNEEISKLGALIKNRKLDEVILCGGETAYKLIINIIQHMPGLPVSFYGKGTNSIVGSNSKNTTGKFVAVQLSGE